MILSDRDIRARLAAGDLKIEPLIDDGLQIQPASVDLRLGTEFIVYRPGEISCLDPKIPDSLRLAAEQIVIREGEAFTLHPGDFALGSTLETVSIPADLVGQVDGRSSIGRLAVVVHATAGLTDFVWTGILRRARVDPANDTAARRPPTRTASGPCLLQVVGQPAPALTSSPSQ